MHFYDFSPAHSKTHIEILYYICVEKIIHFFTFFVTDIFYVS